MRLKATDPEAKNVAAVKVDGKLVKLPLEVDTDEGWCEAYVPLPSTQVEEIENPDPDEDSPLETGDVQWKIVKLTGKVEVFWSWKDKKEEKEDGL